MYVGFCFGWVFPCSSSEQKPSLRQRHSLHASNAESRIRLIVLLTAPKIFAISSITDKKIKPQFRKIVGLVYLIWWDTHTRFRCRHRGNGIACLQATPRAALGFCSANRAENLCYQFNHGQKLLPQFRKIVGLVV